MKKRGVAVFAALTCLTLTLSSCGGNQTAEINKEESSKFSYIISYNDNNFLLLRSDKTINASSTGYYWTKINGKYAQAPIQSSHAFDNIELEEALAVVEALSDEDDKVSICYGEDGKLMVKSIDDYLRNK